MISREAVIQAVVRRDRSELSWPEVAEEMQLDLEELLAAREVYFPPDADLPLAETD